MLAVPVVGSSSPIDEILDVRMGQALRRAAGRLRGPNSKTPPPPVQNQVAEAGRNAQSDSKFESAIPVKSDNWDPKVDPDSIPNDGALKRRDPRYDVMLHKMLGRVRVKQAGMSETVAVDHPESPLSVAPEYKRTIPKLQKTKVSTGHDEDKIVPPGKLDVSQIRQILLLYEGKAENQEKPMDAKGLAQKFQVNVLIVQKILQSVSLPNEHNIEAKGKQN